MESALSADETKTESLEFPLAGELIRCAYYYSVGMVILAVGVWFFWNMNPYELGFHPSWFLVAAIVASALMLFAAHSWRLRVDDDGIHVRRLGRWRSLAWAEIERGRVECIGSGYGLVAVDNPKYFQVIVLASVGEKRFRELLPIVERHWEIPDIPLPSKSIRVRFQPWFRYLRAARITNDGIEAVLHGVRRPFAWADIDSVTMWKQSLMHQDFWKLEFCIEEEKFLLVAQATQTWQGVRPESVVALVQSRIADESILLIGVKGEPQSYWEIEQREAHLRKQLRGERQSGMFTPLLFVGFGIAFPAQSVWQSGRDALWPALAFTCMMAVIAGLTAMMFWFQVRETRRALRELESTKERVS